MSSEQSLISLWVSYISMSVLYLYEYEHAYEYE
jgi:hypothetical protein